MTFKIRIPKYAKQEAKNSLALRKSLSKSQKFGIGKATATKLNIRSGVEQAQKLIRRTYLTSEEALAYYRFYLRFRKCTTPKCEGAISLWGGRRFGQMLEKIFS